MKIDIEEIRRDIIKMSSECKSHQKVEWMFQVLDGEVKFAGEIVGNHHRYDSNDLKQINRFKVYAFAGDVLYAYGTEVKLTPEEFRELFKVYERI